MCQFYYGMSIPFFFKKKKIFEEEGELKIYGIRRKRGLLIIAISSSYLILVGDKYELTPSLSHQITINSLPTLVIFF